METHEHPGVKLLFYQHISPRLVPQLKDLFTGLAHVRDFQLHAADDHKVRRCAQEVGYTIVSKNDDFRQRSFLYGYPPKIIWVHVGNFSTQALAALLRARHEVIQLFIDDPQAVFLALS